MAPETLRLSKHEGAGNDFLVLVDPEDRVALSESEVRNLCDRRRGVGADGVIRITLGGGGAELTMELRNADGSVAETSGNGLRCLAQAAVEAGLVPGGRFGVATGGGPARVEYRAGEPGAPGFAEVELAGVRLVGGPSTSSDGLEMQRADAGNPHLVVRCEDPATIDVPRVGAELAAGFAEGINVEFVALGPGDDELTMRVFERGVGETWACGSGSCAAAAVARFWGIVGERVRVRNPGGTLEVSLGATEGDPVRLGGPVRHVADVVVDREGLS